MHQFLFKQLYMKDLKWTHLCMLLAYSVPHSYEEILTGFTLSFIEKY